MAQRTRALAALALGLSQHTQDGSQPSPTQNWRYLKPFFRPPQVPSMHMIYT